MKIDLSQFRQTVLNECADHIASMETGLLRLRSARGDVELLNEIFRAAHSIKGGAGAFGMANLVRFTHALENLLDRMRSIELPASDQVIGVLLQSVDVLRDLLYGDSEAAMPGKASELVARIEALIPGEASAAEAVSFGSGSRGAPQLVEDREQINLYKVEFRPDRKIFESSTNPIVLLRNLAAKGTVSCCHLHCDRLPPLADLDPSQCYLSWTVEIASRCTEAELRAVFEFVEHLAEIQILSTNTPGQSCDRPASAATLAEHPTVAAAEDLMPAAADSKSLARKPASGGESGSVRVAIDKVDRLIDLVGELVIANVMTHR